MAKNKKKNSTFSIWNSYGELLKSELKSDETLFYVRDSLLPILNIKMLVKERSREELSDTDLILLKLIEQKVTSVDSIVLLTGLAKKLVEKHLAELQGRSFISFRSNHFELTEIGTETLIEGVPIRLVQRAFRYCAVRERLLPREAYDLNFTEINSLREENSAKSVRFSHILEEKQMVNLAGLDFNGIESKRAVNLTDEAMSFSEMVGYSSGYLQTRLFLVGKYSPERAIVAFGKKFWEYDINEILPTIEKLNEEKARHALTNQLSKEGLETSAIDFDQFGLPVIKIWKPSEQWLSKKLESGNQAILLCGTSEIPAKPVPLKGRDLNGYTARYILMDDNFNKESSLLSKLISIGDSYYLTPYSDRPTKTIVDYIESEFSSEELKHVKQLANNYKITKCTKWFRNEMKEEVS